MTRAFLQERGIDAPSIYGDPALLLPVVFPKLREKITKRRRHVFIPNYNDSPMIKTQIPIISPNQCP